MMQRKVNIFTLSLQNLQCISEFCCDMAYIYISYGIHVAYLVLQTFYKDVCFECKYLKVRKCVVLTFIYFM